MVLRPGNRWRYVVSESPTAVRQERQKKSRCWGQVSAPLRPYFCGTTTRWPDFLYLFSVQFGTTSPVVRIQRHQDSETSRTVKGAAVCGETIQPKPGSVGPVGARRFI